MAKKYRSKKGRTGWWRATACARATPRTTGRTTPAATAPIGGRWGARPRAATAPRRPPPRLEPAPVRRPPFRAPSFENQTVHRFRHQVKLDIKSNPPHQLEPSTSVLRREWIRKLICVPSYWWFFFFEMKPDRKQNLTIPIWQCKITYCTEVLLRTLKTITDHWTEWILHSWPLCWMESSTSFQLLSK